LLLLIISFEMIVCFTKQFDWIQMNDCYVTSIPMTTFGTHLCHMTNDIEIWRNFVWKYGKFISNMMKLYQIHQLSRHDQEKTFIQWILNEFFV
jgi:hypothetical protein